MRLCNGMSGVSPNANCSWPWPESRSDLGGRAGRGDDRLVPRALLDVAPIVGAALGSSRARQV